MTFGGIGARSQCGDFHATVLSRIRCSSAHAEANRFFRQRRGYVLELGKYSVIIYNNGKDIVALQNMCSHRFNRIFTEKRGNAPIVCPFHSWGFDGWTDVRSTQDFLETCVPP